MKDLTHKQAVKYIHLRLDGMLNQNQRSLLDEHLRVCDACHVYSQEMESLPAELSHEFQSRWDKHLGPSQNVSKNVAINARRISMANRFSSNLRVLAGAAVLIVMAFAINLVVARLQSVTNASNHATSTPSSPVNPIINPQTISEDLLAFSSTQSGNSEIYTMRPDGSGLTNLTNNPANDSNPIWSPDGNHIAFESDRDGTNQIYWMNADGSNVTQLTHDKPEHRLNINVDHKYNPWSPNGSKILFLQNSSDNNWDLYSIGIDGQTQTLLASAKGYFMNVSWSPDGEHVAYVLDDSPNPTREFWPDIYIVDSDGNNTKELKTLVPQNERLDLPYYWLSDHKSILFAANLEDQKHQNLYEFNLVTASFIQKETSKSRIVDWQPDMALILDNENAMPTFIWQQVDGTSNTQQWNLRNCLSDFTRSSRGSLALSSFCNDTNKFQLYWANADGSASKLLYEPPLSNSIWEMGDVTWSPDEQYVTFMLTSDQTHLYILNVQDALKDHTTQPKDIAIGADQIHAIPSWRPESHEDKVVIKPTNVPQAFRFGAPVENKGQALIAARLVLNNGDYSYVEPLKVVIVKQGNYEEFRNWIGSSEPAPKQIWVVVYYNEEWKSTFTVPSGAINDDGKWVTAVPEMRTPPPPFRGCVVVAINASDGLPVSVGTLPLGLIPECD